MSTSLITLSHSPHPSEPLLSEVIDLARSRILQRNTLIKPPGAAHVVTGTALLTLEALVGAAKGCPFPPLQAASSVALLLLQTFDAANTNDNDLVRLANDACEILFMVIRSYQNEGTEGWRLDMPTNHKEVLVQFVDKVYHIYKYADKQSKRPRFTKYVSGKVDIGIIRAARETLDHAKSVFGLVLAINTNQDIGKILQRMDSLQIDVSQILERSVTTPDPPQVNTATPPSTADLLDTTISSGLIGPPPLTSVPLEGSAERPVSAPVLPDEIPPASTAGPSSAGPPPRATSQPLPVAASAPGSSVSQVLPPVLDETTSTTAGPSIASPSPRAITPPHPVAATASGSSTPKVIPPTPHETISSLGGLSTKNPFRRITEPLMVANITSESPVSQFLSLPPNKIVSPSVPGPSAAGPSPRAIAQPHPVAAPASKSFAPQAISPAIDEITTAGPSIASPPPCAVTQPPPEAGTAPGSSVSQAPSFAPNDARSASVAGPPPAQPSSHPVVSTSPGGSAAWPSSHPDGRSPPMRPYPNSPGPSSSHDQLHNDRPMDVHYPNNQPPPMGPYLHNQNYDRRSPYPNYQSPPAVPSYPRDHSGTPMQYYDGRFPSYPDYQYPPMGSTPSGAYNGTPRQYNDGSSPMYTHHPNLNQHSPMGPAPQGSYSGAPTPSPYMQYDSRSSMYAHPNQPSPMGHTPPGSYYSAPVTPSITSGSGNISIDNSTTSGNTSIGGDNVTYNGAVHETNYNSKNTYKDSVVGSFNNNIWKDAGQGRRRRDR